MRCGKLPLMPPKRSKTPAGSAPLVQLSLFAEEANLARITKLNCLGRNAMDLTATVAKLADMGVRVHCLAWAAPTSPVRLAG
jgi:hypothetical protein